MARIVVAICISFAAPGLLAAVLVTPPNPRPGDSVRIRVENRFGMEAFATGISAVRDGNTIVIRQDVRVGCFLPSNPLVASEVEIGPLPAGVYNVVATIVFAGDPAPLCTLPPRTETASFAVAATDVPALDHLGVALLAAMLAAGAMLMLRKSV